MSKLRWVGAFTLSMLLVLVALVSIGEASTLREIQRRGKVLVGTQFQFPNWGFYDDRRQPAGFDIDMAQALAAAMEVQLELVETISPNRIPYLETKRVDVVISVFSITPQRALRVAFSRPYAPLVAVMLSRKGDGIEGPRGFVGKRGAGSKGTGSAARIRAAAPPGTQFIEFDTPADTFLALRQGKADAAAEGLDGVNSFIRDNPDFAIKGEPLAPHFLVAVGVRQEDHELLQWINTWLLDMENSGKIDELYEKWFGMRRPAMPR